ncbi:head-tail adaptor protein [Neisseria weixii]|uniref:Head-tail adaptor protein n=1 Tax=Neisseria weixii TaxID=1853276 RepID=A0A3N4NTL9_9NEIS|nr:phage head closure protein [Neisseria weixii]RPD90513.1 head-tail adaptor protein [Neisseria weixii]RPD90545.1 head-tail adaptor protein [Neisseria weixii]
MKACDLKHRVTIRRHQSDGQDPETGDLLEGWVDVATVWAKIVPSSVREFLQAAAVQNEISARVVVRYSKATAQITPNCLLIHGQDTYEIKGIMPDPDGGRTYLTLVCAKKDN